MHNHSESEKTVVSSEPSRIIPSAETGTRRSFLGRTALTAAAGGSAFLLSESSETRAGTLKPSAVLAAYFRQILADEADHVTILQGLLNDDDNHMNPKIRAVPTLKHLVQPTFLSFVEAASAFENTGSGTYAGALLAVEQTEEYFPTAAGITTVESRHASWLNSLLNEPLVPNFAPVESPIDQSVTLSRVTPFIVHLNGTKPSFNPTTASSDNNFAILDFLLLLEYIETAFYQVNVAKFFRGIR
jgi:hypothetical protein